MPKALARVYSGTFTPVFSFTTPGDSSFNYTTQIGRWSRIADHVFIYIDLQFDTNAYTTAAGTGRITGIPFTPGPVDAGLALGIGGLITSAALSVHPRIVAGGTTVTLLSMSSNAAAVSFSTASFPASKTGIRLLMSGNYRTST